MNALSRTLLPALLLALASPAALAQQEQARVISSSPIRNADGSTAYSVTYEYAGRQYTTRTDSPPGDSIALQITPMGVTTNAVPDAAPIAYGNHDGAAAAPWQNVTPEAGVVVSGNGGAAPPPLAGYPAPVYAGPAPVYVAPPVYGYGYGYPGYGYPGYGYGGYAYPPIGVSLNLGYSYYRGGGGWRRGWR